MKRKLIISLFVAVIMLAGVYSSYADMCGCMGGRGDGRHEQGMPRRGGMGHPGMGMRGEEHPMWRHLMGLGLDEKQREAIREIRSTVMKEMIKKRADERLAGIELKELLDREPVNMKAVEAKLRQIETAKTEAHLSLIRAREEVKSQLTPEQRKKFREMPEMEPTMGPPMRGGMMHGGMRMPQRPCETKEEMDHETEYMHR